MQEHRGRQVVLVNEKSTGAGRVRHARASEAESIGNRINSLGRVCLCAGAHRRDHVMDQQRDRARVCTLLNAKDRAFGWLLKRRAKARTRRGMKTPGFCFPLE